MCQEPGRKLGPGDPGQAGDNQHVCKRSIVFNQLMEGNSSACMHMLARCSGYRKVSAFAFMDIFNLKHVLLPHLQIPVRVCEPHKVLHHSSFGNIQTAGTYIGAT